MQLGNGRSDCRLDYRIVMVADALAAGHDPALAATPRTFHHSFGDVRPTAEPIELFRARPPGPRGLRLW